MEQIVVDRNLIMLDGKPLALVTPSGLSKWKSEGVSFTCRYDQITEECEHKEKYRCLYKKEGSPDTFLLVNAPSSPEGFNVILFDQPPQMRH